MTGNRSLDEFLAGESEAAAPTSPSGEGEREGEGDRGAEEGEPEEGKRAEQVGTPEPDVEERGERAGDGAPDARAADGEPTPVEPSGVEPLAPTYARSADGAPCAACGATVEVRWRDEAGLVCADCKAW